MGWGRGEGGGEVDGGAYVNGETAGGEGAVRVAEEADLGCAWWGLVLGGGVGVGEIWDGDVENMGWS